MQANRRRFIAGALGASALGTSFRPDDVSARQGGTIATKGTDFRALDRAVLAPVLKLDDFKSPIIIDSLRLLKKGNEYFIHVRSKDGAEGVSVINPPRGEYSTRSPSSWCCRFLSARTRANSRICCGNCIAGTTTTSFRGWRFGRRRRGRNLPSSTCSVGSRGSRSVRYSATSSARRSRVTSPAAAVKRRRRPRSTICVTCCRNPAHAR